jgi:diguanylate cyclase (GGDEF)-like protein
MDLDNFKEVNDTLGHDAGDDLLRQIANRLREALSPREHIARIGGDEFVVIQENVKNRDDAAELAEHLLGQFRRPFQVKGHALRISPSIGIAIGPSDGNSPESLVKCADLALYAVKADGRGDYRFFDSTMGDALRRHREIGAQVRYACENRGFALNYQPIYSLITGELAGFEALLRMAWPQGRIVSPADFMPVAEELGLSRTIATYVLDSACRAAASWPELLTLAVNLSPTEFQDEGVVDLVAGALSRSGLPASRLEIEVTEGVFLSDTQLIQRNLERLKALGVTIVLDDFGTGYSSLSYLWQFAFDKIKIDKSFVRALGVNGNVPDILRTIVALGRALDLRVTAEGVETEAQRSILASMKCDLAQGYLFGRPTTEQGATRLIAEQQLPVPVETAAPAEPFHAATARVT